MSQVDRALVRSQARRKTQLEQLLKDIGAVLLEAENARLELAAQYFESLGADKTFTQTEVSRLLRALKL